MIIKAAEHDIARCYKFAQAQYETSKAAYARRGQLDKDTIIRQIVQGKIAELLVFYHLQDSFKVKEPDFAIYRGKKKNYDADLTDGFLQFHIKSQSEESAQRYGTSWVFTPTDPLVITPEAEDILVLVLTKHDTVRIVGFLSALTAQQKNLYENPKLTRLIGHKVVLYLDTIKDDMIDEL